MRLEGTLRSWNDQKGFGFIAPRDGGREIFAHISSFVRDGSRPTVGESLSYELGRGKDGKPQAMKIARKAIGQRPPQRVQTTKSKSRNSLVGTVLAGLLLFGIAAVGFKYLQGHVNRHELSQQTPQPLITSTATPRPLVVSCGNQRRQSVVVVAPCGHVGKSQSGLSTCPCGLVVHELEAVS